MNVVALLAYAFAAALTLSISGWLLERALTNFRLPARWVWLGVLGLSVWMPLTTLRPHPGERETAASREVGVVVDLAPPATVEQAVAISAQEAWPGFELMTHWRREVDGGLASAAALLPQIHIPITWIIGVWGASSLLFAMMVVASMLRLGRRSRHWADERLLGCPVKISPAMGPATVGLLAPVIVIPRWARELPARELGLVLLHEREHVRARDTLVLALGLIAAIACPWNPLVWWQARRLKAAVELDCDRRILRQGVAPVPYGSLLVRLGSRKHLGALAVPALAGSPSLLERRLKLMMTSRRRTSVPSTLVAMGGALFLAALACTGEPPMGTNSTVASEASPNADVTASSEVASDPLIPIWIDRNGTVEVSGAVQPVERVSAVLAPLFTRETVVSIEAHEAAPYGMVAAVQDEIRAAGYVRVVFTRVEAGAQRPPPRDVDTLVQVGMAMVLPSMNPRSPEGVELPVAGPDAVQIPARNLLVLEALPTGRILVRQGEDPGAREVGIRDVETLVGRALAENMNVITVMRTHPNTPYGHLYEVLAAVQRSGAKRYSLQLAE